MPPGCCQGSKLISNRATLVAWVGCPGPAPTARLGMAREWQPVRRRPPPLVVPLRLFSLAATFYVRTKPLLKL